MDPMTADHKISHGLTRRAAAGLIAAAPFGLSGLAQAQTWPTAPVKLILPFAAGGVADVTARLVAEKLGAKLGQRFVIENTPGAGGVAAARAVLQAAPDGQTLALFSNGTAISVPLFKNLRFDPVNEFVPVSTLGAFDFLFATAGDGEFKTFADVLKFAREKPGVLNVGTVTAGSSQNLTAELLKSSAKIDFRIVPFRATPEILLAVMNKDVHIVIDSFAAMQSLIAENKLRALASSGPARGETTPNLPTVAESGVPGFDVTSWNAIFAPKGVPAPVLATLNKAIGEVLQDADLRAAFLKLGITPTASTPEALSARLTGDIAKWGAVIKAANIEQQ
jgi:tripartite-type tricarboxylate transporter receptor subunit TctC